MVAAGKNLFLRKALLRELLVRTVNRENGIDIPYWCFEIAVLVLKKERYKWRKNDLKYPSLETTNFDRKFTIFKNYSFVISRTSSGLFILWPLKKEGSYIA